MENLTGKQFGPYRIVEPFGAGGMAAVYKGYQASVDRYVAVKVLPRQFADDAQFLGRFEQEAKVLAKLQHPHILPVHDYGQAEGFTYFVMPLVEGGNLADILSSRRLSLPDIGRIIAQVGDALDYAHGQGVVHRDIKPSNILVDQRGNCLLTDFGIAKILEGTTGRLTLTGSVIGTPAYMSPEQGMAEPLDGRSDIYSLGVILYEMITGQVPFKAETPMALMIKHIQDPLPPPRAIEAALPEPIERVILKALAKQPGDRFATAGKMVKALQGAIQAADTWSAADQTGQTIPNPRPIAPAAGSSRSALPGSTNPAGSGQLLVWSAIGVLALMLVMVLLLGVRFLRQSRFDQGPLRQQFNQSVPDSSAPLLGPQPPPEAFEACRGASENAACTVPTPRETISGTCRPYQDQLACIPAGGPPRGP